MSRPSPEKPWSMERTVWFTTSVAVLIVIALMSLMGMRLATGDPAARFWIFLLSVIELGHILRRELL